MKKIAKFFGVVLLIVASSCTLDNDTVNPSTLTPSSGDDELILTGAQLNFASFFSSASGNTDQLVRMNAMTGGYRYPTAITASSANGLWSLAYQGVLINTKSAIALAQAKGKTTNVAIGKILEAYTYLTLVDIFNDVPRTDALKGIDQFSPKVDLATDVYTAAITLLTEARTELAKTGAAVGINNITSNDLFYGGSRTNWTALANTLELKAWLNIRTLPARVAEADTKITALLASNIINEESENFVFKYGTSTVPDSRHPAYNQFYGNTAGTAGGYIGNYFLKEAYNGLGVEDPRWRYYFYRQVGSINPSAAGFDVKALGCTPGAVPPHYAAAGAVFCVFEPGFYGRDHGDASGTPPDSPVITCAGVYPAGGRPDNNSALNTSYNGTTKRGDGANGAGIQPIWLYYFTDYIKAEIEARRGNTAAAKTNLIAAVSKSIDFVKRFADGKGQSVTLLPWSSTATTLTIKPSNDDCSLIWPPVPQTVPPTPAPPAYLQCRFNNLFNDYMRAMSTAYDNAANKLDVIGREAYIAYWGNGVEAYNSYRRTSAPRNLQPTLQTGAGFWTRSFPYPATFTTLAGSTPAKNNEAVNKVFWDGNPETLN